MAAVAGIVRHRGGERSLTLGPCRHLSDRRERCGRRGGSLVAADRCRGRRGAYGRQRAGRRAGPLSAAAVFYPFQTFTKGREVDFSEIPILVETASPDLRGEVEAFARCLSRTVLYADSALRGQVHLAGVFACNFANHLFELGGEVLRRAGVSADLLRPLIAETTAKALAAARPAAVQTGPAVRGDLPTQERHLRLLADDALLSDIYRLITQSIWETSRKIS